MCKRPGRLPPAHPAHEALAPYRITGNWLSHFSNHKKPQGIIPCGSSLLSGNHTSFMDIQLKMDRPVPLAAENPKIDIMKTRYFFLALMSTVNDCMSFPPFFV
jgi:hypothetical protein